MERENRIRLNSRAGEFDDIIRRAREARYIGIPPEVASLLLREDPILQWDLNEFIVAYEAGERYPAERLMPVVDRMIDTKLQLYFVAQVLPATDNVMVYNRGFDPERPLDTPVLPLAHLCYAQAMMVSRAFCGSG